MGFRLEQDNVRKIALDLMQDGSTPWEYGGADDIGYLKLTMYNTGVMDMANEIIKAIEELKRA